MKFISTVIDNLVGQNEKKKKVESDASEKRKIEHAML